MLRFIVTLIAGVGAWMGLAHIWTGCKGAVFVHEGFPITWQLLFTILVMIMSLSVGK